MWIIVDIRKTLYSTRGQETLPQFINFTIRLRLDLGHRLLIFALTTNLESGPRLADIWFAPKKTVSPMLGKE